MSIFTFPLFGCFIVFVLWFSYERKKAGKAEEQRTEEFWQREHDANFTRRKNLDVIKYVTIPFDTFPIGKYTQEPAIADAELTLEALKDKRMLNLTGKTSTELKAEYGVANLSLVNEYDDNYTLLIKTLQQYAEALCACGHSDDALTVLEFAVATGSDLKSTYMLLADIYHAANRTDRISALIPQAEKLDSLMKAPIINSLKEFL